MRATNGQYQLLAGMRKVYRECNGAFKRKSLENQRMRERVPVKTFLLTKVPQKEPGNNDRGKLKSFLILPIIGHVV